ncbi:MAG: CsbD family protein [Candidatus Nanopelagicales bacterium]
MGTIDKAKNKAEQAKGKAKEVIADVTDNDSLKAEGKRDQTKGDAKQFGEGVKDVLRG